MRPEVEFKWIVAAQPGWRVAFYHVDETVFDDVIAWGFDRDVDGATPILPIPGAVQMSWSQAIVSPDGVYQDQFTVWRNEGEWREWIADRLADKTVNDDRVEVRRTLRMEDGR